MSSDLPPALLKLAQKINRTAAHLFGLAERFTKEAAVA